MGKGLLRRKLGIAGSLLLGGLVAVLGLVWAWDYFFVRFHSTGENVIEHRLRITTAGTATKPLVWSPDGKQLLCQLLMKGDDGRQTNSLWLFDLATATGREVMRDSPPRQTAAIAWSPDGKLIAIVDTFRLSVLSVPDFKVVAHRETPRRMEIGGIPIEGFPTAAFSSDSKSFWISLPESRARTRFTLAVALDAVSLEVVDRFEIEPPIPGNRHHVSSIRVEATPRGPRLVSLVASYTGVRNRSGADTAFSFAYAVDLSRKAELFPHFQLIHDNEFSRTHVWPVAIWLPLEADVLIATLTISTMMLNEIGDEPQIRNTDVYQPSTGQRLSYYDRSMLLGEAAHAGPPSFGLTSDVVISDINPNKRPENVVVYEPRTGKVVQRLTGPLVGDFAFTVDHRRMAMLSPFRLRTIEIFAVNR